MHTRRATVDARLVVDDLREIENLAARRPKRTDPSARTARLQSGYRFRTATRQGGGPRPVAPALAWALRAATASRRPRATEAHSN